MPKERKSATQESGWIDRIPKTVTFIGSVVGLISATAGLWLLWPRISDSIFGPKYQVSYDYVVADGSGLACVAKSDATLKIGDKSIGLLQNNCQKEVVTLVARNDLFRVWYVRVANTGPEIPKVSVVQTDGSSYFNLRGADVTLACLGYQGRPGRESKKWMLTKLEFSNGEGIVKQTVIVRKPPADEQLKGAVSDCNGLFVGYPPV